VTHAQLLHCRNCPLDLIARWHQRGAVFERPTVVFHVRDFDSARAKGEREINHLGDPVDIRSVHDAIDGERQLLPHDFSRQRSFPGKCARIAGDMVG
jgi:hypothetical protein